MEAEFVQVMRQSVFDGDPNFTTQTIGATEIFAQSNSKFVTTKNVNNLSGWSLNQSSLVTGNFGKSFITLDMPYYSSTDSWSNTFIIRLNLTRRSGSNQGYHIATINLNQSQYVTVLDENLFSRQLNVSYPAGWYNNQIYRGLVTKGSDDIYSGEKKHWEWIVRVNQKFAELRIDISDLQYPGHITGASIQIKRYSNIGYNYEDYYGIETGTKTFGQSSALLW